MIELIVAIVIIGILASIAVFNFISMQMRAKETSVKSNCHTVQLTAEDFAVQNHGAYAADVDTDATPGGHTIVNMLPSGALLENPFTKVATEPISGAAATAGQTGYVVFVDALGINAGYTITGFGRSTVILTLTNGL